MAQLPKYYIVEAQALPEVFLKVAEAKWLLETGEVATVDDAARATGISRSAFYKYRDSISPFQNLMAGRILTFQLLLRDMTGLLSSILTIFAQFGANILTINQAIPTNGCASVTISAETSGISRSATSLRTPPNSRARRGPSSKTLASSVVRERPRNTRACPRGATSTLSLDAMPGP